MQIVSDPKILQQQCLAWRLAGHSIAVVPTMGFFHAGHESLMKQGRTLADKLIVTLFVNPSQFGPTEDLDAYPRNEEQDMEIAKKHGADILFMPSADSMYEPDHGTWITVPDLSTGLCGITRPTHFRGVCTVVAKLFMLTQPTAAVFGEKDWQQLAILRRMVRDLFIPVQIFSAPIVREADGLALSSRNAYLQPAERGQAPHLQKGLAYARQLFLEEGITDTNILAARVRHYWQEHLPLGKEDYLVFVQPDTLQPLAEAQRPMLVAAAVYLGKARLIDNICVM